MIISDDNKLEQIFRKVYKDLVEYVKEHLSDTAQKDLEIYEEYCLDTDKFVDYDIYELEYYWLRSHHREELLICMNKLLVKENLFK